MSTITKDMNQKDLSNCVDFIVKAFYINSFESNNTFKFEIFYSNLNLDKEENIISKELSGTIIFKHFAYNFLIIEDDYSTNLKSFEINEKITKKLFPQKIKLKVKGF
jgi:hypothetical protein